MNRDVCEHFNPVDLPCAKCGAERVQEPVAWIYTDPDKPNVKFLEWREDEPAYRGRWIKTPLYIAPSRHDTP